MFGACSAHNDDPYADYFLLNIDSALKDAKKTLTEWQNSFTELANSSLVTIDQVQFFAQHLFYLY
jgi:hypothetical protein